MPNRRVEVKSPRSPPHLSTTRTSIPSSVRETSGRGPGETGCDDEDLSHPLPPLIRFDSQGRASSPSSAAWASTLARMHRIVKGHCRPTSDGSRALEAWRSVKLARPKQLAPSIMNLGDAFHIEPIRDHPEQAPRAGPWRSSHRRSGSRPSECASMVEVPNRIRQSSDALTLCFSDGFIRFHHAGSRAWAPWIRVVTTRMEGRRSRSCSTSGRSRTACTSDDSHPGAVALPRRHSGASTHSTLGQHVLMRISGRSRRDRRIDEEFHLHVLVRRGWIEGIGDHAGADIASSTLSFSASRKASRSFGA